MLTLSLKQRWNGPGGMAHVLAIAVPMILSTSAHAIQMFTDRMFLSWHSSLEFAASMQASITSFTLICFFIGVTGYANTFVAQYTGSGQPHRVGPSIWQSVYFSLIGCMFMLLLMPQAQRIFSMMGHEESVQVFEVIYFKIICISCIPAVLNSAFSCFYTGRGRTWVVFAINVSATILNIVLDYLMVFGKYGFSEMGIAGAGWATVISGAFSTVCYLILFFLPENRQKYNTLAGIKPDWELFGRLIKFGCPNGLHFMLDVAGFTFFIMFMGQLGNMEMAASNMAFQLNHLAFFPMIGLSIAISTITGQALGKDKPEEAVRATKSSCILSFGYMIAMALGFVLVPDLFMMPFGSMEATQNGGVSFEQVRPLVVVLLRYIAVYCLFDTGNIVFSGVLKGAGDTRFVMLCSLGLCWGVMVIPTMLFTHYHIGPGNGLYFSWIALTLFICLLALVFYLRYAGGAWRSMRVIENQQVPALKPLSDVPMEIE